MSTRRLAPLLALVLLLPALLAGCDRTPTDPAARLAGTFTLHRVNGVPVPAAFYEDPEVRLEVLDGSLTLTPERRFQEVVSVRLTDKVEGTMSTVAFPDEGTYTVQGSTITFASSDPEVGTFTGTVSGETVTVTGEGISLVFRRG